MNVTVVLTSLAAALLCQFWIGGSQVRVACVGDSITAYSGFPDRLAERLGAGYTVTNLGEHSSTAASWSRSTELFDLQPELIVVMLGTNNAKTVDWSRKGQAGFVEDYSSLLRSLYRSIKPRPFVYLCLPTPAADHCGEPDKLCGRITANEIVPAVKDIALMFNLPLIDTYTPFLDHMDFFGDGVHPDKRGADTLAAILDRALRGL